MLINRIDHPHGSTSLVCRSDAAILLALITNDPEEGDDWLVWPFGSDEDSDPALWQECPTPEAAVAYVETLERRPLQVRFAPSDDLDPDLVLEAACRTDQLVPDLQHARAFLATDVQEWIDLVTGTKPAIDTTPLEWIPAPDLPGWRVYAKDFVDGWWLVQYQEDPSWRNAKV